MTAETASAVFDQVHVLGGGMLKGRRRVDAEEAIVDSASQNDSQSDIKGNDLFIDELKRG